jgi:hypothetical protein
MRAALDKSAKMDNWNEEAIPWLEAFVKVHKTIFRKETEWPDRLVDQFTAFPSWVRDSFDAAAGFNNPELSLHKIAWTLMEAKAWYVSIGGETRTLKKVFSMVTGGLVRTIKAAADSFDDKKVAQVFVTTLCCVFNGYCEGFELDMRMILTTKPKPVEGEGEQGEAQKKKQRQDPASSL